MKKDNILTAIPCYLRYYYPTLACIIEVVVHMCICEKLALFYEVKAISKFVVIKVIYLVNINIYFILT